MLLIQPNSCLYRGKKGFLACPRCCTEFPALDFAKNLLTSLFDIAKNHGLLLQLISLGQLGRATAFSSPASFPAFTCSVGYNRVLPAHMNVLTFKTGSPVKTFWNRLFKESISKQKREVETRRHTQWHRGEDQHLSRPSVRSPKSSAAPGYSPLILQHLPGRYQTSGNYFEHPFVLTSSASCKLVQARSISKHSQALSEL